MSGSADTRTVNMFDLMELAKATKGAISMGLVVMSEGNRQMGRPSWLLWKSTGELCQGLCFMATFPEARLSNRKTWGLEWPSRSAMYGPIQLDQLNTQGKKDWPGLVVSLM